MKLFTCIFGVFVSLMTAQTVLARSAPESFADTVVELMPAVVNISTSQTVEASKNPFGFFYQFPEDSPLQDLPDLFERFYGDRGGTTERKATSLGSGFIIDESGYIVTNSHVIENAEEITVTFSDDSTAAATVVGRDSKTDIALLKVDVDHKLPHVKWGDSDDVRVGDWVIAIGNPFGLGGSVSAGIISARARDINAGPFDDFLQTDAAINRGNSGGPLFNTEGEVVGVNSAIFSPSGGNVGIGFAIPTALVHPVIDQLRKYGKTHRGWLGVKIQTVSKDIADSLNLKTEKGALVIEVTAGSPAEKAGILAGDVILSFDSHEIPTMRKLPRIVAETELGKKVPVVIWRDNKKKTLIVTIGELEEDKEEALADHKDKKKDSDSTEKAEEVMGLKVVNITPVLQKRFKLDKDVKGIMVMGVDSDSQAAKKGIRRTDVILSVNQKEIEDIQVFKDLIEKARKQDRKSVLFLLQRHGEAQFIAVPLDKD